MFRGPEICRRILIVCRGAGPLRFGMVFDLSLAVFFLRSPAELAIGNVSSIFETSEF
jgi:hypothetical protein